MKGSSAPFHRIAKTPLNSPPSAALALVLLFAAALSFSSCAKDDNYDESRALYTETISIGGLTAEVDDASLKAMGFTMGKDTNGKDVPLHRLEDGKVYQVHTALSNGTAYGAATLNWKFQKDPDGSGPLKDRLIMENGQSITLTSETAFTPGAAGWYVSGVLGGTLNSANATVSITPTRELTGVDLDNLEGSAFDLEVPFAIPWTEVTISSESSGGGTRTVASNESLFFIPMGSLIGYELGNTLATGTTFTPTGFTVLTNAFVDECILDFKPQGSGLVIPSSHPRVLWNSTSSCSNTESTISYTFATSTPAGTISNGDYSRYRYYAWVMPRPSITAADTKILMSGVVTGSALSPRLNLWSTNYTPTGSGVPQPRKSYRLKASLSGAVNIKLPIEAVAEYNLAGGSTGRGNYAYPQNPRINGGSLGTHLDGLEGVLRFANREPYAPTIATYGRPYDNDASGYYNWYVLTGTYQAIYNPNTLNLQTAQVVDTDGGTIRLNTKYYIPAQEDWWGVFSGQPSQFSWTGANSHLTQESFRIGYPDNPLRFTSSCSYANPTTDGSSNAVVYALRFVQPPSGSPTWSYSWYNPVTGANDITTCYPPIPDNSLVCAYRYTRVGSHSFSSLTDHLKVEVWHLGEAGYQALQAQLGRTPTGSDLQTYWGSATVSSSPVITRLFPSAGYYHTSLPPSVFSSPGFQINRGRVAPYWSSTVSSSSDAWFLSWDSSVIGANLGGNQWNGYLVRPFLR